LARGRVKRAAANDPVNTNTRFQILWDVMYW
jgi:hypothetical protein